jgi:PPOX class probable F420-dependent enzyme
VRRMDIRGRVAGARVARLATADGSGVPHLVPIVFALDGEAIHTCVDDKPKTTRRLRRLTDIAENPRVCVLVDHYSDDWSRLWWIRIDGIATVHGADTDAGAVGLDALARKYAQYRATRPPGPVITIDRLRWRSWSA